MALWYILTRHRLRVCLYYRLGMSLAWPETIVKTERALIQTRPLTEVARGISCQEPKTSAALFLKRCPRRFLLHCPLTALPS